MYYELTYLLNPNTEEPESSVEDIVNTIEKEEGEVESQSEPEEIELGSTINPKLGKERLNSVLMGTVEFYLKPKEVNNLRDKIIQKKDVLRGMIISKQESVSEPETETQDEDKKVELEDIDQKLDEILEE